MTLSVTAEAARQARAILAQRGLAAEGALRVFVAGNPIAGYRYGIAVAKNPGDDDVTVQAPAGLRVVMDYDTAVLLADAELDYAETDAGAGFTVYHENELHTCHPLSRA